jgi:acyl dehydratase
VRFAAITQLGDRIRCTGKVVEKLERAGKRCVRLEVTAAKASGEVTLAGEALVALN